MHDWLKVIALFVGCVLCCQSIRRTVESRTDRQWLCTMQALERDGLWHLWIFERPIPSVNLKDLEHAHKCVPGCRGVEGWK